MQRLIVMAIAGAVALFASSASPAENPNIRAAPSFHSLITPAGSVTTMASGDSLTTAWASHSTVTVSSLLSITVPTPS